MGPLESRFDVPASVRRARRAREALRREIDVQVIRRAKQIVAGQVEAASKGSVAAFSYLADRVLGKVADRVELQVDDVQLSRAREIALSYIQSLLPQGSSAVDVEFEEISPLSMDDGGRGALPSEPRDTP